MSFIDITNVVADVVTQAGETTLTTGEGLKFLGQGIGAGLAMIGSIGVGIGEGITAAAAASAVGRNPEAQPKVMNIMIVGMAITESVAIYALIVSILLIFVMN